MILKNYTTNKDYLRTIGEIEQMLSKIGARKIMKEYNEQGEVFALSFTILYKEQEIPIRLPARIERIPSALRHHYNNNKETTSSQRSLLKQAMQDTNRARNIGWRILQDWLEATLSIMQLDQINMLEALLPFTQWGKEGKTLYDLLEQQDFNPKKMGLLLENKQGENKNDE